MMKEMSVPGFDPMYLKPAGLPDGLFSNQKSQFGKNSQGLRLENIEIFYGHLGYFLTHLAQFVFIWYIFSVLVSCNDKNLATLKTWFTRTADADPFFCIRQKNSKLSIRFF
jgi:hypothetical protein